jgi:threonylcarbamoyladenosine tRNA methylthiotransferase MtaB
MPMTTTVALETLGCKVNQYESSYFLEVLKEAGYRRVPFKGPADVYVVHGCAVTARATFQTRQLLRRAQRLNPEAIIVSAGCQAQLEPERMAEERLATHILGNPDKFDLIHWLRASGSLTHPLRATDNSNNSNRLTPLPIGSIHSGRARAFLKVQDGCDASCSYCVVPYVRGKTRSLPEVDVHMQLDRFLTHGYQEVVLTGIHLGQWGKDLAPPQDLYALLTSLNQSQMACRVRLSSLEPMEWGDALMKHLPQWEWVCPHFHIPMQSGDAVILERMRRPYTPHQYAERIMELHHLFPYAALGADVLVGFPGETEKQFDNTFRLIDQLPLTYLHAFPFSPRQGTPAASMPGRVTSQEMKRRVRALQDLSNRKKRAFQMGILGQSVEVLAETEIERGWWQGTSENYLRVIFPAPGIFQQGLIARVKLLELTAKGLMGKPVAHPLQR